MAGDRAISVKLKLDAAQAARDARRFGGELRGAAGSMEALGGRASSSLTGLKTPIASVSRGVATMFAAGVASSAALGTSLAKTGIAYNTLEQTSRAAFTQVLGSAKAANKLMDDLGKFAKTSPFPRQAFIEATRQLIAFGFTAEQVVPTLDAIQNAVARTGGSADDIGEIAAILSKINSTGKFTALQFNQLGLRGVNAAKIIGTQLGRTEDDIRKSITKGSIDGRKALDLLIEGMGKQFAGAAAGVKKTFTGAVDRVKSAWRDIGSIVSEPLVRKTSGGLLVDFNNEFADLLRLVESKAEPVVKYFYGRLAPAINGVSSALGRAKAGVQGWNANTVGLQFESFEKRLKTVTPLLGGASAAMAAYNLQMLRSIPLLGRFVIGVNPVAAAIMGVVFSTPSLRKALMDTLRALEPLGVSLEELVPTLAKALTAAIEATGSALGVLLPFFGQAVVLLSPFIELLTSALETFTALPQPVQAAAVALGAFLLMNARIMTGLKAGGAAMVGFGQAVGGIGRRFRLTTEQAIASGGAITGFGRHSRVVGAGLKNGLGAGLAGLMGMFGGPFGLAVGAAVTSLFAFGSVLADSSRRVDESQQRIRATLTETARATSETTREVRARLDETGNGWDQFTRGVVRQAKTSGEVIDVLGGQFEQIPQAIAEGGIAYDTLYDKVEEATKAFASGKEAALEWGRANGISEEAIKSLSYQSLRELSVQMNNAKQATDDEKRAIEGQNTSLAEAERYNDDLRKSIDLVSDSHANLSDRVQAVIRLQDELNGVNRTATDATFKAAKENRDLDKTIKDIVETRKGEIAGLIDLEGNINPAVESGRMLREVTQRQQESSIELALAKYDEVEATKGQEAATAASIEVINQQREAMYKSILPIAQSKEAALALTNQLYGLPAETAIAVTDKDSITRVRLEALALGAKVRALPDKTITISTEHTSEKVIDELKKTGYTTEKIPDSKDIILKAPGAKESKDKIDDVKNATERVPKNCEIAIKQTGANETIYDMGRVETRTRTLTGEKVITIRTRHVEEHAAGGLIGAGLRGAPSLGAPFAQRFAKGGVAKRLPLGGLLRGPGSKTSDSIPVMASMGEYVMRAAAVDKYGKDFMDAVNMMSFDPRKYGNPANLPQNITVNVPAQPPGPTYNLVSNNYGTPQDNANQQLRDARWLAAGSRRPA